MRIRVRAEIRGGGENRIMPVYIRITAPSHNAGSKAASTLHYCLHCGSGATR
jgi:hypothetical protein